MQVMIKGIDGGDEIRIYTSSPYECNRADTNWKLRAAEYMQKVDGRVVITDPCPDSCNETPLIDKMRANKDWLGMYSFCANIVEGDLAMLNRAHGNLTYLPADAKTYGTTHEMIHSLQYQIPLVVVVPEGLHRVSHWLWGILGPNRIFDNLEDAAKTLVRRIQVVRGEKLND